MDPTPRNLPFRSVYSWLDRRIPLSPFVEFLSKKEIPRHKHSIWYYFGGLTLFFLIVQIISGILLLMYYRPSPDSAHESIVYITNEVPFGWIIRSVHSWGAHLMVAMILIHMFSVYLMKAYRKPREMMWLTGVALFFLTLGFGFTGYLLPWDTMAYFATLIGTEIPKSIPVIGKIAVGFLTGGEEVGPATLTRMYAIHVVVLPLLTLSFVGLHLVLNQVLGQSVPIGVATKEPRIPFFPNFALRDLRAWAVALALLSGLAIMLPWPVGEEVDPLASAPEGIKPDWYFLVLYQTLRIVPSAIFSLSGEMIVNLGLLVVSVVWLLIPFLDRKASVEQKSPAFTYLGVAAILYMAIMIALAYLT